MRPLLEIATIFLLVAFGWNQSFRDHWHRITGRPRVEAQRDGTRSPTGAPRQAPAGRPRESNWMWGPTKLDPR